MKISVVESLYSKAYDEFIRLSIQSGYLNLDKNYPSIFAFHKDRRKVLRGTSEMADGWTDGETYIVIDKAYMNKCFSQGYNGLIKLIMLLIHESCHDSNTSGSHDITSEMNMHRN